MSQPPARSLLHLAFETHEEFRTYQSANATMLSELWRWHENLGNRQEPFAFPGVCDLCQCQTSFSVAPQKAPEGDPFDFRVNWWAETTCHCGMSNLGRAMARTLLDGHRPDDHIYHIGQYTFLRNWLAERLPNITSSQYDEGRRPGEIEGDIRYEDLTHLSFADATFDCVICMEILEHIPDYHSALREMARVLKPGGRALLSFPWLGGDHYQHLIRAELRPDGSIHHILPPEYHGDPDRAEGILSFRAFGWKILDELREAGFARASANFLFGPLHGYMTLVAPVIVATR
jgi:hypothetical protein